MEHQDHTMSEFEYTEPVSEHLLCSICHSPYNEPVSLPCSHIFCKSCITQSLMINPSCPIDRKPFSNWSSQILVPANSVIRNILDDLKVYCPNRKNGCDMIISRSFVKSHVNDDCPVSQLKCSNSPCEIVLPRHLMSGHNSYCPFRKVTCEGCSSIVYHQDLSVHKVEECPAVIKNCPECKTPLASSLIQKHLENQCLEAEMKCINSKFGCEGKFIRKNLEEHLKECSFQPIRAYLLQQEQIIQALEEEMYLIKNKNESLEHQIVSFQQENEKKDAETQGFLVENQQLRQEIEVIHEEIRNQDIRHSREMMRMREELEGLHSFCQVTQMQLSRLILEKTPKQSLDKRQLEQRHLEKTHHNDGKQQGNKL